MSKEYNLTKIKVKYETLNSDNPEYRINDVFEEQIKNLANSYGLEFVGSGYDFENRCRDLEFKGAFEDSAKLKKD